MEVPRLEIHFETPADYLAVYDKEVAMGGMLVRGATLPQGASLGACTLVVRIGDDEEVEVDASLGSAMPGHGVAVLFDGPPPLLVELARRLRAPRKRETLNLQEKMQLAISCDRELRLQLLRDPNKQLHPLVLKNPRIALDEVQWAARSTTLNPDGLKLIAEHPEWGQNASVAAALVRNPKTPLPVALKLVPKLGASDLKQLARSQGRPQLVQAAKKLLMR